MQEGRSLPLYSARNQDLAPYKERGYVGYRLQLADFEQADVQQMALELYLLRQKLMPDL